MQTLIPRLPVSKGLRGWLETGTGKPVGLSRQPRVRDDTGKETGDLVDPPFYILYPLFGVRSGPPFAAPEADVEFTYQLRMLSTDPAQLEWMYDRAIGVVVDRDISGAFVTAAPDLGDLAVMDRRLADEDGGNEGRDIPSGTLSYDVRFIIQLTRSTP